MKQPVKLFTTKYLPNKLTVMLLAFPLVNTDVIPAETEKRNDDDSLELHDTIIIILQGHGNSLNTRAP